VNRQAKPEYADKEALFAALDLFVNSGDSLADIRKLRLQCPSLFGAKFYDTAERRASLGKDEFLSWYKYALRQVWQGQDSEGKRLAVLLGLRYPLADSSIIGEAEDSEYTWEANRWYVIFNQMNDDYYRVVNDPTIENWEENAPLLPEKSFFSINSFVDWRSGEIRYEFDPKFCQAVYLLMKESWRARVCQICKRYFVAAKPAQFYCSTKCYGEGKRRRALDWWRKEGSARRQKSKRKGKNR
jgi:hypothetical protein